MKSLIMESVIGIKNDIMQINVLLILFFCAFIIYELYLIATSILYCICAYTKYNKFNFAIYFKCLKNPIFFSNYDKYKKKLKNELNNLDYHQDKIKILKY